MLDPARCPKKSADVGRLLPQQKVMVDSQEKWDELGGALVKLGVFRVINFSEMPIARHRYFVFRRPVSGAAVGRPDMKDCHLAAVVLPMGFSAAAGIVQS